MNPALPKGLGYKLERKSGVKLKALSVKDKGILSKFLGKGRHELSVYAFENIYIWKGLFDIYWSIIEESLCVFFKDKFGCFLYLAPLSGDKNPRLIKEVFRVLDGFNKNREISRIENVEGPDAPFYESLGYDCRNKSYDYVCLRSDLAHLTGSQFKSKRASYNYFIKHHEYQYLPFSLKYKDDCLALYNSWAKARKAVNVESLYRGMIDDSRLSLENALDNYPHLDLTGKVVKINGEVKAFTFGFRLNRDTFCILYEITDLAVRGLSQFIFRRFCSELEGYKYINIMDDSGLDNLKAVKLSYHPANLIPAYIVKRK